MKKVPRESGIGLVEAIIALSIVSSALVGAVIAHGRFVAVALENASRIKAHYLAEEGIEAARFLRDSSWSTRVASLPVATPYHLAFATSTSVWEATTTPQTIDGTFERSIMLESVYRRTTDDDIVASTSPGLKVVDPNIRKVTVRVTWGEANEVELSTYLTDLFEN